MKKLVLVFSFIAFLFSGVVSAQDCKAYYPLKEGSVREMKSYDKKDKFTGSVRQKVTSVETLPNGLNIIVDSEFFDDKGEMVSVNDMKMSCVDGVFTIDMQNYLNQASLAGLKDLEIKIDAVEMEFPRDLAVGQQLKDASINMVATNMGITMMKMTVNIKDRNVEAIENVTTPAGSFSCYKISYTSEVQTFGKYTVQGIDWYAEDVGAVRSESYDKNGKLDSYSVLTHLE